MSEIDRQPEASIDVAEVPISDSYPVASPSRRRIIRLGASAVPVLATLTSQSALADACISTSAWGSAQISNSASEAARHASHAVDVTTGYTISAWNSTDSPNAAWTAFTNKFGGSPAAANALTFADLYAIVPRIYMRDPSSFGFTSGNKVVGGLGNNDESFFLVAMLNYAVGAKPPTACVTDANWLAIVANQYPTIGSPWTVPEISLYLQNNYIVVQT